ncbi:MAG: SNF1-interacting protein [Piccolia ochrophora]|nr:MAG: SNF1-interacting protein [Piccolia ochrophora]
MADIDAPKPGLEQVAKPVNLIPVGLKEAALDSPTFRATTIHFSDQVELVERWLDGYVKSTGKLVHEVSALEDLVNTFLARSVPPASISEAVFDHDYTLLAVQRYGEGAREFWSHTISGMRKMDSMVIEPIRAFLQGELRNFKEAKKYFDQAQKTFDGLISRYAAQTKTKEASSLREDAFQLYEARKAYIRASIEFCVLAPQVRSTLDKLLVRIFSDQWQDLKKSREALTLTSNKWGNEMERIRSWSVEMEVGEKMFKKELQGAGRLLEETATSTSRPSRELDDYAVSSTPYMGSKGPSTLALQTNPKTGPVRAEKQSWLFLRTLTGKPTRTVWIRRWFFVKNGIFGWLVQGSRTGGVEESDRIGVLLCNVKPAFQEERRFCFEVKTKDNTILLQAETHSELTDWIETFENAKRKALEDTSNSDDPSGGLQGKEAAFAISPPSAPEFAAKPVDSHGHHGSDDLQIGIFDRSSTLPVPELDSAGSLVNRSSFDVTATRRLTGDREGEGSRDHAARIIQKLDLHRKSNASPQLSGSPAATTPTAAFGGSGGGIASLISSSHNILPVYSTPAGGQAGLSSSHDKPSAEVTLASVAAAGAARDVPFTSLAPSTLANPPAPTNLSKTAVVVSGERGIGIGLSDVTGGMPSGIMANLWGSSNWGYINRIERGEINPPQVQHLTPGTARPRPSGSSSRRMETSMGENGTPDSPSQRSASVTVGSPDGKRGSSPSPSRTPLRTSRHRNTISLDTDAAKLQRSTFQPEAFPPNYPVQLKTQEAQFRMLFPNVPLEDKVLLVFRATWNPNDQQEFPGRVYVTPREIYFYSHHLGLVLTSSIGLDDLDEVTAAPGKECDFLFLHFKEGRSKSGYTRVTVKIFLGDLRLLQRRLNLLIEKCDAEEPPDLQTLLNDLIRLEQDDAGRSPSIESWEEVPISTPVDSGPSKNRDALSRREKDLRASLRVDRGLHNDPRRFQDSRDVTKFKLPTQPVEYRPKGISRASVERKFDISPKALFHVIFGDKSAVFQLLYQERRAHRVKQSPWISLDDFHKQRQFEYEIEQLSLLGQAQEAKVLDSQSIDVLDDHLCYVVTDRKTPWHLPYRQHFLLISKIVVTHVAKSRCKLTIYTHVEWTQGPPLWKDLIERQAYLDLDRDALDLADVVTEQVGRLGAHSRTKKAIHIFGHVGHQGQGSDVSLAPTSTRPADRRLYIRQHTLPRMLLDLSGSVAESAVSSLIMWTFAALESIWKICNAHSILLGVLVLSITTNLFYSSRDTSIWWSERGAVRFMARMGVHPNSKMSKAVYLYDIEEVIHNQTDSLSSSQSKCFTTFQSLSSLGDPSAPVSMVEAPLSYSPAKATARRLRRTREHIALHRHDLLVAMRVVNSIERETVFAQWENWLSEEMSKCGQLERILKDDTQTSQNPSRNSGSKNEGRDAQAMKAWYEEYCGSCQEETQRLQARGSSSAARA